MGRKLRPGAVILVSTTLTGNNEAIIGAALRSVVGHVDKCLVIKTVDITDSTLAVARDVCGDKLEVHSSPWTGSFSDARNFALKCARSGGADWALTLDTDERIDFAGEDVRAALDASEAPSFAMREAGGRYSKDRAIRLPTDRVWVGGVHEYFEGSDGRGTFATATFTELARTPEHARLKLSRDLRVLLDDTRRDPSKARWWYYLGDTLASLGRHGDAVLAFDRCYACRGPWQEEGAWAMVRAATCLVGMLQFDSAIERAVSGLARCPYMGELATVAAIASMSAQKYGDAVCWAHTALGLSDYALGKSFTRTGFVDPSLRNVRPGEILSAALEALGNTAGAAEVRAKFPA